ncbi:MAG: phage protein GemA/Gp16 family protein, partial [Candidatus Omnitrophota bacterium]
EYRRILMDAAGVNSAKELDEEKFRRLMRYFVYSKYYRLNKEGLSIKQKLFIDYLVRKIKWTDVHLANFMRKYLHKDNIYALSRKDAIKLIEALKNIWAHSGNSPVSGSDLP